MIIPEFFDIFGIPLFIFIIALSWWMLRKRKMPPNWAIVILLCIGVAGLTADIMVVLQTILN